ncbi:hypothetical protein EXIGLDRAFT_828046 [Exidia glandulosa HHB12029]|uniref:Protein EFR3 n=1 Tax=Exidia glandulosa HHB12029 TaxID=1314781 RepID=A0A165QV98_EXIGL|nr:hypothetical protein EXIGLDRAFT_828046 [Exidia glandulosa HHB12029]
MGCMPASMTSNHVRLIDACYPPSAVLASAAADFRPNAQELSRLTYYASNRPGKLTKLGVVLEKRTRQDARKAATGHVKSKASLLVTLGIYKALATECKNDVGLLTPSLLAAVDATLSGLPSDLEVAAKTATVFTAWATFTDGNLVGPDGNLTPTYLNCLRHFARLSVVEATSADGELRNRTRLVGLAAFTAVVNADVLQHASANFVAQTGVIVPALLHTVYQAGLDSLQEQTSAIKAHPSPSSPYLNQFQARPHAERRAASIHVHVDGEKGPSFNDVSNACLRVFQALFSRCGAGQVAYVLDAYFAYLDNSNNWDQVHLCCWFAERAAEWTQYQYRYAVPTKLVERLLDAQDTVQPTPLHTSLVAMITTVFTSPAPLINLSTSDIISNLITLILRRVAIDPLDGLLPPLVECTASLGAHVYYSDQVQDLAAELISRLVGVQVNGLLGRGRFGNEHGRNEGMRCLLVALVGLMQAGDKIAAHGGKRALDLADEDKGKGKSTSFLREFGVSQIMDEPSEIRSPAMRRTRVRPDTWQDTLAMLCESEYAVRAEYARALVVYIKEETPREVPPSEPVGELGLARKSRAEQNARRMPTLLGDITARFLHALHASAYSLAVSSSLGLTSATPPQSHSQTSSTHAVTAENVPVSSEPGTTEGGDTEKTGEEKERPASRRTPIHRPRQLSLALSLLEPAPEQLPQTGPTPVGPSDYSHLLEVLTAAHEQLPTRSLLSGVPMLLALDAATQGEFADGEAASLRRRAVRELVGRLWLVIARVWECDELKSCADKALASLPPPSAVPPVPERPDGGLLRPPEQPLEFVAPEHQSQGESSNSRQAFIDPETVLSALAGNRNVQLATGLEGAALLQRLNTKWTMELALRDSVERTSGFDIRPSTAAPFVKLMHIENMSMQSLARSTRGVGVSDLREALEGRSSMSNPNLVPSIRTYDQPPRGNLSVAHEAFFAAVGGNGSSDRSSALRLRSKSMLGNGKSGTFKPGAGGQDVRDVLNRIVGKPNGSSSMLKTPFAQLNKRQPATSPIPSESSPAPTP